MDEIAREAARIADMMLNAPRNPQAELSDEVRAGLIAVAQGDAEAGLAYLRGRFAPHLPAAADYVIRMATHGGRHSGESVKIFWRVLGIITDGTPPSGSSQEAVEAYNRVRDIDPDLLWERCLDFVVERAQSDPSRRRRALEKLGMKEVG